MPNVPITPPDDEFRDLIEHLPGIVYLESVSTTRDAPGHLLYVSPQVEELLGFTPEEWISDPTAWARQIHPDDRERVREGLGRAESEGTDLRVEYRMFTRDGRERRFLDRARAVAGPGGTTAFRQGFLTETTPQRDGDRGSSVPTETVAQLLGVAIYLDPPHEGPTIAMSTTVEGITGYTAEEWLADPGLWRRIVLPEDLARLDADREDERAPSAYRIRSKGGRTVWLRDASQLLSDPEGRPVGWLGVLVDVTADQRLDELEMALAGARDENERLRAEDAVKTAFLQTVSHDLRTPLAAILGLAVTLRREDVSLSVEEARDLAGRIATNARRLDAMVSDFLDLERLRRGLAEPRLERIDLGALVRELVTRSELVADRRLALDAAPITVDVDPGMVGRILENLLRNAVKHTPGDSRLWVRVERDERGAILIVEDDGPGIPPELREVLFEEYRQGPGAAAGTGIGLAIVARFAELHGGRAWVEERRGGGASFHVLFGWRPSAGGRRPDPPDLDGLDQPANEGSSAESHA